jgi:hypothetical protein
MCFKRIWEWLFPKPDPEPEPEPTGEKRTALLFAINNYPGTVNDLNGCLNDQTDLANWINDNFSEFVIKKFADSKVTCSTFVSEIKNAVKSLVSGDFLVIHYSGHGTQVYDIHGDEKDSYDEAVYLYDGPVIDDDINSALGAIPDGATVLLLFDSCFSGTVTRNPVRFGEPVKQNRFHPMPGMPIRKKVRTKLAKKGEMKWIVISGCGEEQTSADAYISGRYNGAFTYYLLKSLSIDKTYQECFDKLRTYLPSKDYDQAPTLEGKTELFNKLIFT